MVKEAEAHKNEALEQLKIATHAVQNSKQELEGIKREKAVLDAEEKAKIEEIQQIFSFQHCKLDAKEEGFLMQHKKNLERKDQQDERLSLENEQLEFRIQKSHDASTWSVKLAAICNALNHQKDITGTVDVSLIGDLHNFNTPYDIAHAKKPAIYQCAKILKNGGFGFAGENDHELNKAVTYQGSLKIVKEALLRVFFPNEVEDYPKLNDHGNLIHA